MILPFLRIREALARGQDILVKVYLVDIPPEGEGHLCGLVGSQTGVIVEV
jgi:hypothetical protein